MNPSSFALLGTGAEDCTHGRTRTKERQRLITDFPDSNRFHRLLRFDYALCPQRARTITLWYGTPVGFGRAKRPEVVPKKDHPGCSFLDMTLTPVAASDSRPGLPCPRPRRTFPPAHLRRRA